MISATKGGLSGLLLILITTGWTSALAQESLDDYLALDMADLLSVEVTSVSKRRQPMSEAAAAIFVITQEDIVRSGVTSIPEALRLAPGLQVARMDSNKWAISSRGSNAQYANKLLVLIDGRNVYTPAYSGVNWEDQDTLLDDIDRIEVIRGPGATLWGANAVNGVINIITRSARETPGGLASVGSGNEEQALVGLRYGGQLGDTTYGRVYARYTDRDSSFSPLIGGEAGDQWDAIRGGFRMDGETAAGNNWTLQGDYYNTSQNQVLAVSSAPSTTGAPGAGQVALIQDAIQTSGWNVLGRWEKSFDNNSYSTLQIYLDHTRRADSLVEQEHDTLDLEYQRFYAVSEKLEVIWGAGYRLIDDKFGNEGTVVFTPDSQTSELVSGFLQADYHLSPDRVRLSLGSKFEHNVFTGFEWQPSARLLWRINPRHSLWTALSRAVRTPSRVEDSATIRFGAIQLEPPPTPPVVISLQGSADYDSEDLLSAELGYRFLPSETLSVDLAAFYSDYQNLSTLEQVTPFTRRFDNQLSASSFGFEGALDWTLREWWKLQLGYTYFKIDSRLDPDSADSGAQQLLESTSPDHQLSVRSSMNLGRDWSVDLWTYYVDSLPVAELLNADEVPDYVSTNIRVAWRPNRSAEISLVSQNLFDSGHLEFNGSGASIQSQIEPSTYLQLRWQF